MDHHCFCKAAVLSASFFTLIFASGCTQNPMTGKSEFTGLMPAQQEASIGAAQHAEITKQFGGVYENARIQSYVSEVGQKMAQYSERQDVQYRFTVLDSPIVNAFALPGGYVYVTRGTLAVANSEAELAAVLGHEIGHVAAHHQAARYSQGVLTQLGASVLGAAIGIPAASQAIGLGSNLYMSSYSRDQETQADQLGVRYLSRSGYDMMGMSNFLRDMNLYQSTNAQIEGKNETEFSYFSSHPDTAGRVQQSRNEISKYPVQSSPVRSENRYLSMIRGLPYGESATQGFVRDGKFYHPDIGFLLSVPPSFNIDNQPQRIAIEGQEGTVLVLDMTKRGNIRRAEDYVSGVWLKGQGTEALDTITVGGMPAATTSVNVNINNQPAEIRLIAIEWSDTEFVRMQILIPRGASNTAVDDLKRISYSFRRMNEGERNSVRPYKVDLVTARAGDTIQSLAANMAVDKGKLEQFAALNGLTPATPIIVGRMYKVVR
jgi:predicted Zn-dependent protease